MSDETCDHVGAPTWRIAGVLLCAICDAYLGDDPNQQRGALDAAWAEAEAALPGWHVHGVEIQHSGHDNGQWWAEAETVGDFDGALATTPAAALRALAARLRGRADLPSD